MNRRNFLKSIGAALVVPSVLGRTSTTESIDIPFIIDESTMTATARAACDIRVGDCCMFADEKYNTVIPASSPISNLFIGVALGDCPKDGVVTIDFSLEGIMSHENIPRLL